MNGTFRRTPIVLVVAALAVVCTIGAASGRIRVSQQAGSGEWRYWGGDAGSTRYSPLNRIDSSNVARLQVAWTWRADNFGPSVDYLLRAVPIYANGKLFSVAGSRRTVVAIDPATGETLWSYREPHTERWAQSTRQDWGKGVAYADVGGRGVIYMTSPGYFLHALDAETGRPLEGFGKPVPLPGFGQHGTVDMLADLPRAHPYDVHRGPADSLGFITTSSPPIVVNGVVIVGSALADGGAGQTRIENIPGDVLAYDARTGKHLWTFKVIPGPGEVGHQTWENDAWKWTGNTSAWAPLSADLERGVVYVPTESPTNDIYGGFRPGDNLFGNSIVALDAKTGKRIWHFQTVHHDIWDWDNPLPPILADLTVNGERIPAAILVTKQALAFTFNRITGKPVWPIEERPVPQSTVPGERTSPTQPIPARPAAWEIQGISETDLVDFSPAIRQRAVDAVKDFALGPLFMPAVERGNPAGKRAAIMCPSTTGGTNVTGGAAMDPETGILYVASVKQCSALLVVPGRERDNGQPGRKGKTVSDWIKSNVGVPTVDGLPIVKPPYGRITAIDMNTGETLWWIPNGTTPSRIVTHALLRDVTVPNTGVSSHANVLVTKTLLLYGEGRAGAAMFHAVDKRTGKEIGSIQLPAPTNSVPMTYQHQGRQFIVVAVGGAGVPAALVALSVR
jgi:glucose dehydrogenase